MAMTLQALIDKQYDENVLVLRAFENATKSGPATKGKLEARLKLLDDRWNGIVARHAQIEELLKKENAPQELDYVKNKLYEEYENFYADERGKFIDAIHAGGQTTGTFGDNANGTVHAARHLAHKLPPVEIPKFSGKYQDWASFKDLFQAVVRNHPSLTDGERLARFKSSLVGEAAACIKSISDADGNYARACSRLVEHFENKRSLVHASLEDLFQIKPLSSESASGLRTLRDSTVDVIETLEALKRPVKHWDDILVHLTVKRLDATTRRDWQTSLGESKEPATFKALDTFLQTRIRALELSGSTEKSEKTSSNAKPQGNSNSQGKQTGHAGSVSRVMAHATTQQTQSTQPTQPNAVQCSYCKNAHYISSCSSFQALNFEQRRLFAKENKLCFNCLGGHLLKDCRTTKNCKICNQRHHTSLHLPQDTSKPQPSSESTKSSISQQKSTTASSQSHPVVSLNVNTASQQTILLATARVVLSASFGRRVIVKALVDPCSEATFISENVAQLLKLPRQDAFVPMTGVGGSQCNTVRTKAKVSLSSYFNEELKWELKVLILPHLTDYMMSPYACNANLSFVKDLCLADPKPDAKLAIDMIIGADLFPLIINEGLRKSEDQTLIAQASSLGWIITGSTASMSNSESKPVTSHRI